MYYYIYRRNELWFFRTGFRHREFCVGGLRKDQNQEAARTGLMEVPNGENRRNIFTRLGPLL